MRLISSIETTGFAARKSQFPGNTHLLICKFRAIVLFLDSLALVSGGLFYEPSNLIEPDRFGLILLLSVSTTLTFYHWQLYKFDTLSSFPNGLAQAFVAIIGNLFLLIGALAALGFDFTISQHQLGISIAVCFSLIFLARWIIDRVIASWLNTGRLIRNVAVIGAGGHGQRLFSAATKNRPQCQHLIGVFDERKTRIDRSQNLMGDIDTLVRYARNGLVQHIIIALPWSAEQRILDLVARLRELPIDISLSNDLAACHFAGVYQQAPGIGNILLVDSVPASGLRGSLKWMEDKLLAMLLAFLLTPIFIIIVIAIKLDSPGPILFRQRRYGFNRQPITVYKFRTMQDSNQPGSFKQASRNDPRITRVGGLLRKASLDELAQLFNVLQGDMSLVGPRPHPIALDDQYSDTLPHYDARFRVKPGITGWAQINGWRGETETREKMLARIQHDIYYIEKWSLWFDFRILIQTTFKGWAHGNAY